jgi:predicted CopG family antitoxin
MGNITLTIPEELHEKIKRHNEIRWSEVVRRILQKNIEQLEMMERIVRKSRLTDEDAGEIADRIDSSVSKKLGIK